ncbi:hypothetical protein [Sporisorium scitamineum]|uniref:Transcription factor IIIC 90kDa subunit N-terminal domain-containing protein n=1 Tax=Sporisorium scitamineum TaxID=49012 RepID=A0A0F7RYL7_9BASI|nr:hypothetical protein [Sporisorium scitamineum]
MAGNPKSALKGSAVPPSKDRARIRACSIALSSGSQHIGNLQWSELGQALVVTDDYIIILSPLTGLHPALAGQSRTQDVECHPDWNDRFPHSVAEINVKTFLENEHSVRRRTLLESDHSAVDPRFQSVQWSSACWSRPGMGSHTSCLILATTSELDLFVLGAPLNAWTGEWKLLHAVSLDPIADLTDLDATPSSGEKEVFSRSRALLRKKQMATEVTCASFVDLDGHTDVSDRPQPSSDYVIAGTRSGHIGVWNCAAVTGHCTFVSATSVSSTSIEKLVVSSQVGEEQTDLQARIAFKDADGVKLCGLHGANGHAEVRLLTASPINTERGMITAWRWVKDQLVYATISKINVFDSMTQQTTTFSVGTGPFDDLDPFSPVVEISLNSASSFELKAVLLDLREYSIPLLPPDEAQSEPEEVLPTLPSALTGYPPMTENLQREHNLYQAFLGYAVEPRSRLSTASMVGAVRTDEKVAFLGYNSSDTLCYQLEVLRKGSLVPSSLLDEALESAASGTPPYLAVRIIFALLYTSKQRKTLWTQFVSAIEERGLALAASSAGGSGQETTTAERRQRQLLYLLACRLEDSASKPSSSFDVLKRTYREAVLRDWIQTRQSFAS